MDMLICFLLCCQLDRIDQKDPVIVEEVKYRYKNVILHYRKSFIQENAQRYPFLIAVCSSLFN